MRRNDSSRNRLFCGDCVEVIRDEISSGTVDLVVTDPPYLVNYESRDGERVVNDDNERWLKPAYREMYRVLKDNRFCVSFYGWNRVDRFFDAWKAAGFRPVGHLVWAKPYASRESFVRSHHEMAYLLAKGQPRKPVVALSDVLDWRYTGNRLHPTQKPVVAILPLIMAFSQPKDVVLDPFAGSGTTLVAAEQMGRQWIGIELSRWHYQTIRRRLQM